jgi:hypothetical protein
MARGRYQTRNSRVAEITGSHMLTIAVAGQTAQKRIWDGNLMDATGVKPETAATWDDEGNYLDGGVGSSFGLCIVMSQEPNPEPASPVCMVESADPAVLHNQILLAALVDVLKEDAGDSDEQPMDTLKRIIEERNRAESEPTEVAEKAHALDELMQMLAKELSGKPEREGESPAATVGAIIGERNQARRQVAELLKAPVELLRDPVA